MSRIRRILVLVSIFVLLLSGCTTSAIKKENPSFAADNAKQYALVYLMRPSPIRTRGVADYDVTIEFGEKHPAVDLSAGEYAAFKLKPKKIDVITRSITFLTAKPLPVKVWRSRNFNFEAGKTYYINIRFTQEEFRGIYFVPVEISKKEAQDMLIRIKPAGDLAKQLPIS